METQMPLISKVPLSLSPSTVSRDKQPRISTELKQVQIDGLNIKEKNNKNSAIAKAIISNEAGNIFQGETNVLLEANKEKDDDELESGDDVYMQTKSSSSTNQLTPDALSTSSGGGGFPDSDNKRNYSSPLSSNTIYSHQEEEKSVKNKALVYQQQQQQLAHLLFTPQSVSPTTTATTAAGEKLSYLDNNSSSPSSVSISISPASSSPSREAEQKTTPLQTAHSNTAIRRNSNNHIRRHRHSNHHKTFKRQVLNDSCVSESVVDDPDSIALPANAAPSVPFSTFNLPQSTGEQDQLTAVNEADAETEDDDDNDYDFDDEGVRQASANNQKGATLIRNTPQANKKKKKSLAFGNPGSKKNRERTLKRSNSDSEKKNGAAGRRAAKHSQQTNNKDMKNRQIKLNNSILSLNNSVEKNLNNSSSCRIAIHENDMAISKNNCNNSNNNNNNNNPTSSFALYRSTPNLSDEQLIAESLNLIISVTSDTSQRVTQEHQQNNVSGSLELNSDMYNLQRKIAQNIRNSNSNAKHNIINNNKNTFWQSSNNIIVNGVDDDLQAVEQSTSGKTGSILSALIGTSFLNASLSTAAVASSSNNTGANYKINNLSFNYYANLINSNKLNQRYKLLTEGDVYVCRLPHSRNVISKILNSKLLRRWKSHRLVLTDTEIYSTTVILFCFFFCNSI
jgi:hypothetical protein